MDKRGKVVLRIGAELGVIVAGVLVALWVDSLDEARSESESYLYVVSALTNEVDSHIADLDSVVAKQHASLAAMREVLGLSDHGWEHVAPDSIFTLLAWANSYYRIEPSFGAYDVMVASDRMRLLPSADLAAELARYRARAADGHMEEPMAEVYLVRLADIQSRYGGSRGFMDVRDLDRIDVSRPTTPPDIRGLMSDPQFAEALFQRILLEDNITSDYLDYRRGLGVARRQLGELGSVPGR
jgi:hypothetical protein